MILCFYIFRFQNLYLNIVFRYSVGGSSEKSEQPSLSNNAANSRVSFNFLLLFFGCSIRMLAVPIDLPFSPSYSAIGGPKSSWYTCLSFIVYSGCSLSAFTYPGPVVSGSSRAGFAMRWFYFYCL